MKLDRPNQSYLDTLTERCRVYISKLEQLLAYATETCQWTFDETHGKYDTQCGEAMQFTVDGPTENGFRWCPYCGRLIEVKTDE